MCLCLTLSEGAVSQQEALANSIAYFCRVQMFIRLRVCVRAHSILLQMPGVAM